MSEVKIELGKRKLFFALTCSILFIATGIKYILDPAKYISFIFRNTELIRITGFAMLIFSALGFLYILFKAFDKKPGLIISKNGITDNSHFCSAGLIKWSEIIGIRTHQVMSTKFLLIDVSNPEKFIRESSSFKAWLMKTNLKMYNTPLSITF